MADDVMLDADGLELRAGDMAHLKRGREWVRVWVREVRRSAYGKKQLEVRVDNGERWDVDEGRTATLMCLVDDPKQLRKWTRPMPPAVPLAKPHRGLRISAVGAIQQMARTPLQRATGNEIIRHLEWMAERFYAGDLAAVDTFLQLFDLVKHRPGGPAGLPQATEVSDV